MRPGSALCSDRRERVRPLRPCAINSTHSSGVQIVSRLPAVLCGNCTVRSTRRDYRPRSCRAVSERCLNETRCHWRFASGTRARRSGEIRPEFRRLSSVLRWTALGRIRSSHWATTVFHDGRSFSQELNGGHTGMPLAKRQWHPTAPRRGTVGRPWHNGRWQSQGANGVSPVASAHWPFVSGTC